MGKRGTVTLVEVLALVVLLLVAGAVLVLVLDSKRHEARRIRCRSHLNCMAKAMATYLVDYGESKWYPFPMGRGLKSDAFSGAEWVATKYWVRICPNPNCLLCPSSGDTNHDGRDLGTGRAVPGLFGAQTVSYAAMGDTSMGIYLAVKLGKGASYATSKLAVRGDFSPNEPMACDDTQEPINHGTAGNGGMNVLFFDSHVEWWTHERVDLERGVGTGELVHLRN